MSLKIIHNDKAAISRSVHVAKMRLKHMLRSGYWRGHHVHSPFVYHIVRDVITSRHKDRAVCRAVRAYKASLLADETSIHVLDLGAGGRQEFERTVADIARRTPVSEKYGLMLTRLVRDVAPRHIVEIGTSLGVSTAYMALADASVGLTSVEGSPAIAAVAAQGLSQLGLSNAAVVVGSFDSRLPDAIGTGADFFFIDGNHTYESTMRYFRLIAEAAGDFCTVVFDDIHWSEGMTHAWLDICSDSRVMTSIELARMGIIFFRRGCQKEHFVLRW